MARASNGSRRKRRRPWFRILLVLLLAVLIWMYFDGRLPRFGQEPEDGAGKGASPMRIVKTGGTVVAETDSEARSESRARARAAALTDEEKGRRERLSYLIEAGDLRDARVLALSMLESKAPGEERSALRAALAVDAQLLPAVVRSLDAAVSEGRLSDARARREDMLALGARSELAARQLSQRAGAPGRLAASAEELTRLAADVLPLEIDDARQWMRMDGESFVMRERGTSGLRFHSRGVDELDVASFRAALMRRGLGGLRDALVEFLTARDRVFAARMLRSGALAAPRAR